MPRHKRTNKHSWSVSWETVWLLGSVEKNIPTLAFTKVGRYIGAKSALARGLVWRELQWSLGTDAFSQIATVPWLDQTSCQGS